MEGLLGRLGIEGPPFLKAVALFAAFFVVAYAADFFVDKVVRRLARLTKGQLDDRLIDRLHKPVFYTIVLVGTLESLSVAGLGERASFFVSGAVHTVLVLIWSVTIVRVSNVVIEDALLKRADTTGLGREVVPLVENVWKVVVFATGLMVALSMWKVSITPLFASAGIVGAAVAFASKDTISNFFGGIMIFLDRPYKIGDYIVLDRAERGEVVEIGIRSTRIKTRDDVMITVPNSIIANTKVINESAPVPNFRVRVPVSVAYGTDMDGVERLLLEIASENKNILGEPSPRVRFREMGESSLNLELLCWAEEPSMRGLTLHELNRAIYKKFGEAGIRIPFPQRDVHIYREDA